MSNILGTMFSYLRIPLFASSGLAALGSSLLYFKQNDIIYPANLPAGARTNVPTPEQFNITQAESIKFPTPDGETLHAYLLRPPTPSLRKNITLVTFHGNAGNVGHRLPIGKVLSESLGCHVFMVEYRGYGLSTGSPDENGLSIDGQTALDYVRNHQELRKTQIVLYGQSLGGALVVKLLQTNEQAGDIAGVILENTFLSIRKLIPSVMPPAKYIAYLCHQRWNSEELMAKVTDKGIPILFLSGRKDEIVPPSMMKTLYETCPTKKIWKEFPNGDHNSTVAEAGYFDAIWEFLVQEVLKGRRKENFKRGDTDVDRDELWS
ncbi:bem46 protein, variant [Elasticomyces elasticus]|uniref:Bem46 protein, variant n=1 Tax=Exophiala sideris TaxID=1016849 RepID=A0ABR0J9Q4_9EURO|nr:bem46 protein, variant [Elasticomyces elasticus]KAK5022828.1 bem46 protein, variant [Exophiala sideris]KAK5026730.1 bem46 protein, variant [Exophiala sideris]KAK5059455.1 bem46 protein, variant [Exophiala sideris]KAK5177401.1 bem46 protein, variant [Eurotiomycetes sp. CCFEE 6388]